MLLDTVCNSKVYHQNAYYLLGLVVGMSGRKAKRRIEDLQSACEMGTADWAHAYDRFLLGSVVAPDKELFDDLVERMKDPEFALTQAFFWFWPIGDGEDAAVAAIAEGDRTKAFEIWRRLSTKSSQDSVIARHNLAVLFHYYAIDAENQRLLGKKNTETNVYLNIVDRYWRTAFSYWEGLVDDDDFWDVFALRVKEVGDPRLQQDFVNRFRRQFPVSFDNINADFLVAYARVGKLDEARRHFVYMTETMRDSDDVDETLKGAFKPQIDKLQLLIRNCRESKIANDGLNDVQSVLDGSKNLFHVFRFLLPSENRMCRDLMNDVANAGHHRLLSYAAKTKDFDGALDVEKQLLPLATTTSLKSAIETAIKQLEEIIRKQRDEDTCWYCKTYRKDTPKEIVKMYGDLAPDGFQIGRVTYSKRQIPVPVCWNCKRRFSHATVRDYPPIQRLLATGWKIGDRPTNAEIDAVWRDIVDELKDIFGRRC